MQNYGEENVHIRLGEKVGKTESAARESYDYGDNTTETQYELEYAPTIRLYNDIVVIDYDGTLDLSLCRAEENGKVPILFSCGDSCAGGKIDCAGNAFDDAAERRLVKHIACEERAFEPGKRRLISSRRR